MCGLVASAVKNGYRAHNLNALPHHHRRIAQSQKAIFGASYPNEKALMSWCCAGNFTLFNWSGAVAIIKTLVVREDAVSRPYFFFLKAVY